MPKKTEAEILEEDMFKAMSSFAYFIDIWNEAIPDAVVAPHQKRWAKLMQNHKFFALLASRNHLKSSTVYAYVAWLILRNQFNDFEILYLSFKAPMAEYHTKNIKKFIRRLPYFQHLKDGTPAESIIKLSGNGGKTWVVVEPDGVLAFKRGRHPDQVICDDILADPANTSNTTVLQKINTIFKEDITSLPKQPHGGLLLVGTPQDPKDLFFSIRANPGRFVCSFNPAIVNEEKGEVLWEEMFPIEKLQLIREEIGVKSFNKEYMIVPARGEEMFFKLQQILDVTNKELVQAKKYTGKSLVVGGWDLGKKNHPSHIAVYVWIPNGRKLVQIRSLWMDRMDYWQQYAIVKTLMKNLHIDTMLFDNTRGEFEMEIEKRTLPIGLKPVVFTAKLKRAMATELEKAVCAKSIDIEMLDDERQRDQILQVDNNLNAMETEQGHGDSFWSNAMALWALTNAIDKNTSGGGDLI